MNAALELMFAIGESVNLDMAALQDASPGHSQVGKAAAALGYGCFSRGIQTGDEASSELSYFREGVGFATFVNYVEGCAFSNLHDIRFKVPAGIRRASGRHG